MVSIILCPIENALSSMVTSNMELTAVMFSPVYLSICLLAGLPIRLCIGWNLHELYFVSDLILVKILCLNLLLALTCSHSDGYVPFNAHLSHCLVLKYSRALLRSFVFYWVVLCSRWQTGWAWGLWPGAVWEGIDIFSMQQESQLETINVLSMRNIQTSIYTEVHYILYIVILFAWYRRNTVTLSTLQAPMCGWLSSLKIGWVDACYI